MPLRGHDETPSQEDTDKFIRIVNDFVLVLDSIIFIQNLNYILFRKIQMILLLFIVHMVLTEQDFSSRHI